MDVQSTLRRGIGDVGDDFIPATDHCSKEFAELENERIWPRVWRIACREDDIPEVGNFCTYDIVDNTIIAVRPAPDKISTFHNACTH